MQVREIYCEYPSGPVAIATDRPRFGWTLSIDDGDSAAARQTAYRIQLFAGGSVENNAAGREPADEPLWDSGWVESARSQMVEYGGRPLSARSSYRVRVAVLDAAGVESAWSRLHDFELSKLDEAWRGEFVGLPGDVDPSRPFHLRGEFTLDRVPERARVYASALGVYELYVNGRRVGDEAFAPGWTAYEKRLAYQTCDVTDLLREGRNVVGAAVGAGWYAGELTWFGTRQIYGGRTAFIAELFVDDEREPAVVTDPKWRASHGPILYSELYHGERFDARQSLGRWSEPGYDAAGWQAVERIDPDPVPKLVPQEAPPVRPREQLSVREVITTPRGETVLDFGQNITGRVRFTVSGEPGRRVVLSHAEVLDAEGNFYTENLRSAECRIEYTLAGGEIPDFDVYAHATGEGAVDAAAETYEPHFTFQGFRYVRVDDWPGDTDVPAGASERPAVDPAAFTAVVLHSDMSETIEFESSNAKLNRLHENIRWGWKGNALDIPTDCPQRDERLGWTGDAQVFAGTATYLTDCGAFFTKWLRDLAADQREDGGVPFVIPDVLRSVAEHADNIKDSHSSTGWGDAAVIIPWIIYRRYGDRRLLAEQYPSMKAWVEYIRAHARNEVIWDSGFHFGDWVALDAKEGSFFGATPNDLTATAYYAWSAHLLSLVAAELGRTDDEAAYRELSSRITEAFRDEFFTPSGRLAARTQTAHLLVLAFDLVPDAHRRRTVDTLVELIRENDDHLVTGFLGTPLLCPVLAANGRIDVAYELLMREEYPSWLYQVNQGATTIWEHWDGLKPDGTMWSAQMNSFNHYAYGAIGEWIYATLGGIDLDASDPPGRRFVVSPRPGGGITSCRTVYHSLYGPLAVEWRLADDQISAKIDVPANTEVTLRRFDGRSEAPAEESLAPGRHQRKWDYG